MGSSKPRRFLAFMRKASFQASAELSPPPPPPDSPVSSATSSATSTPSTSGGSTGSSSSSSANQSRGRTGGRSSSSSSSSQGQGGEGGAGQLRLRVAPRELFLGQNPGGRDPQGPESELARALREAVTPSAHDWVGHRTRCILLLHLGLESGATKPLQDALEHAAVVAFALPQSNLPDLLKAVAYFFLGQRKPALAACQLARQHDAKDVSVQVWQKLISAESELSEGSLGEASRSCTEGLLLLGPSSGSLSWALHKALFSVRTALLRVRSLALLQQGSIQESRHDEEMARAQGPSPRTRAMLLGELLVRPGCPAGKPDAVAALTWALEEDDPEEPDQRTRALLHLAQGRAAWDAGDFFLAGEEGTRGVAVLEEAPGVAPHFASMQSLQCLLLELCASASHMLGKYSEVLEAGESMTRHDAGLQSGHMWQALGLLYLQSFDGATRVLDHAQQEWPSAQWPVFLEHVVSGALAAKLGTQHKAVREANQGIALFTQVQEVQLHPKDLALCHRLRCHSLWLMNERDSAVVDARESLRLEPGNQGMEAVCGGVELGPRDLWNSIFASVPVDFVSPDQNNQAMTPRSAHRGNPHPWPSSDSAGGGDGEATPPHAGAGSAGATTPPQCRAEGRHPASEGGPAGEERGPFDQRSDSQATSRAQGGDTSSSSGRHADTGGGGGAHAPPLESGQGLGSSSRVGESGGGEGGSSSLEVSLLEPSASAMRISNGSLERRASATARGPPRGLQKFVVRYTYAEMSAATDNFSPANKLGSGAYGTVYRGHLRGTPVAVKRMLGAEYVESGVEAELAMLSRIRHPHIVTLMGHCPEGDQPCIVYEFLPGGDMYENLDVKSGAKPLSALDRFRIAKEMASALVYMAQHDPPIVHRDLKPQNIMLDQHRSAKIADWGLAKNVPETLINQSMAGTKGYIAPELASWDGELSTVSDVYAFGVILLQLMTGVLKPGDLHRLAAQISRAAGKGRMENFPPALLVPHLDPAAGAWPEALAERLLAVALRCIATERTHRPSLTQVVLPELSGVFAQAAADSGYSTRGNVLHAPHRGPPASPPGIICPGGGNSQGPRAPLPEAGLGGSRGAPREAQERRGSAPAEWGKEGLRGEPESAGQARVDSGQQREDVGGATEPRCLVRGGSPQSERGSSPSDSLSRRSSQDSLGGDKVEEALGYLDDLQLADEETADAAELLCDPAQAKVFCALRGPVRKIWIKKRLQKT